MTNHTLGGVLDGHHTVVTPAGLDLIEDTANAVHGQGFDGVAEVLESSAFGEGTLGAQVGNRERFLQRPAGGHDFLKDP